MAVNSTVDFLSNCTFQSGSNFSGDPLYQCMDSFPGNVFTYFNIILSIILFLPLNCWILWLVTRNKGVGSSDFVILNQSVAEVICGISLTVYLSGILVNNKVVFIISNHLSSTYLVSRPLFQTFFCVERYLAVVHPLVYLKYTKDHKPIFFAVGLVWLIILICGGYPANSYPLWFFLAIYSVLLVVCSSCSVMILWVLKRPKPGDGGKEGAYQLKRKAFVAVTVILITLVFGYGTVSCVIALRDQLPYHTYCLVLGLSWCTLLPSNAIQPYLYLSKINRLPCIKNIYIFLEMIINVING